MNGKWVHSPYDPRKEAERFLDRKTAQLTEKPTLFFLNGAGLGYLSSVIARNYPSALIISVSFFDQYKTTIANQSIFPQKVILASAEEDITALLSKLTPQQLTSPVVLEWEPETDFFKSIKEKINRDLINFFQRRTASLATGGYFGYNWMRNMVINFLRYDNYQAFQHQPAIHIIAASGPSLRHQLPAIKKNRKKFRLWSLPSSYQALLYHGIVPDSVISTDAGYYARTHFHFPGTNADTTVSMPFTSAPLPESSRAKIAPFLQMSELDTFFFSQFPLMKNLPAIPEAGTVAASALSLASSFHSRKTIFTGLDLGWHDLQEHISPHTFDEISFRNQSRTNTLHNYYFNRMEKLHIERISEKTPTARTSPSLNTYREWFNQISTEKISLLTGHLTTAPDLPETRWDTIRILRDLPPLKRIQLSAGTLSERRTMLQNRFHALKKELDSALREENYHYWVLPLLAFPEWNQLRKNPNQSLLRKKMEEECNISWEKLIRLTR